MLDQTLPHDEPGGEQGHRGHDDRGLRGRAVTGLCGATQPSLLAHLTIWQPQLPADSALSGKTGSRSCGEVVVWSAPGVSLCHRGGVGWGGSDPSSSLTPLLLKEPLWLRKGISHPLLSDPDSML